MQAAGRLVRAGALVWAAVWAVGHMDELRRAEAALGARIVEKVMGAAHHVPGTALVYYPVGGDGQQFRGLEITWQCSVVWAAVPILVMAAAFMLVPRVSWWRVGINALIGLVVVAGANQLRLVVIALSTAWWGSDGFMVSHRVVGSGMVLVSVAIGLAFVWRAARATSRWTTPDDG